MFEGGLRVPCIVRWPKQLAVGRVCDEFLTSLEIYPTLINAANLKAPPDVVLDGFNMLPILQGQSRSTRQDMFWQRRNARAARVAYWKWIDNESGGQLFNLAEDLGEQRDLSSTHAEVMTMIRTRFDAWRQAMDESPARGPFRDF
jgi:arylsulfatase A-like enzyme